MKKLILILLSILFLSCSSNDDNKIEKPCEYECGILITKQHFRSEQRVQYTYKNECGNIISNNIFLNQEQLGSDNGIQYFINNYSVGDYYCI